MSTWHNRGMPTLLVASAGGHFDELLLLRSRLGVQPEESTWVTWDTAQTRSALGSEERIFVERCQPKDLIRVLQNTVVARRVLSSRHWDRVISTGSIVAVPFLTVARYYGVASHYIESAARMSGPSLSARILERVPGVHCYAQSRTWTAGRRSWQSRGSVFDSFDPEGRAPREIKKVVVSLGTSRYPFPRLVTALRAVLPQSTEVVWQIGPTAFDDPTRGRTIRCHGRTCPPPWTRRTWSSLMGVWAPRCRRWKLAIARCWSLGGQTGMSTSTTTSSRWQPSSPVVGWPPWPIRRTSRSIS